MFAQWHAGSLSHQLQFLPNISSRHKRDLQTNHSQEIILLLVAVSAKISYKRLQLDIITNFEFITHWKWLTHFNASFRSCYCFLIDISSQQSSRIKPKNKVEILKVSSSPFFLPNSFVAFTDKEDVNELDRVRRKQMESDKTINNLRNLNKQIITKTYFPIVFKRFGWLLSIVRT